MDVVLGGIALAGLVTSLGVILLLLLHVLGQLRLGLNLMTITSKYEGNHIQRTGSSTGTLADRRSMRSMRCAKEAESWSV